jgi:hypothetical protein
MYGGKFNGSFIHRNISVFSDAQKKLGRELPADGISPQKSHPRGWLDSDLLCG